MIETEDKPRFITGFTGMRALAVLAVILYHFNPTLFAGGYLGVPIFLTLSGYLITDHLVSEYDKTGHFAYGHFWYKRLKRLYPTLITMLVATGAYITLFQRNLLAGLWQTITSNLAYVYNWWEIANGQSYFQNFAGSASPFTHLWTLAIEGQFYLIWPLIAVFLLSKLKNKRSILYVALALSAISAILMAVLFVPGKDPSRVYYGTDTRAFSILLGAALAIIWPSTKKIIKPTTKQIFLFDLIGLIGMGGMIIIVFTVNAQAPFLYQGGMLIFSILTTLGMLAIVSGASHWNRLLTNRVFDWIGSRSYEIYVYQLPVFVFFGDKFKDFANHEFLYAVIEVALILIISELSYRFIEIPFGKYNYKGIYEDIKHKDFKSVNKKFEKYVPHNLGKIILLSFLTIITVIGMAESTTISSKAANHTKLATSIQKNAKNQNAKNSKLANSIRHGKRVKRNTKNDAKYEKDGLTKAQLNQCGQLSGSAIGDSVMLAGRTDLQNIFPNFYINAQVSKQAATDIPVLQHMKKNGLLGKNVIIGLGTNGNISEPVVEKIMKIIGPDREVFWINVHSPEATWQNTVNTSLKKDTHRYKNLHVIDWNGYISKHKDYLYSSDETHPNKYGSQKYATFIAKQVLKYAKK